MNQAPKEIDIQAVFKPLLDARIESAHFCPETGLIALGLFTGKKQVLYLGIGPSMDGIGIGVYVPKIRAPASHPLVAAMRAHLLDRRVEALTLLPSGFLRLGVQGPEGRAACLEAKIGRKGWARVLLCDLIALDSILDELQSVQEVVQFGGNDLGAPGEPRIDDGLGEKSDAIAIERRKSELFRSIKQHKKAIERRMEAISGDLARLSDVPQLQKIGRLLVAQAANIPKGSSKAELNDWEEGGTITIDLDPAQAPKSQAEGFFKKARRYQRGEAVMKKRLSEAEDIFLRLDELAGQLEQGQGVDAPALEALAQQAKALGVRESKSVITMEGKKVQKAEPRLPYHEFFGEGGQRILVGRGGADNDALTLHIAKPFDLWLHAKGVSGAHVVVPLQKNHSCPPDVLGDAAMLAAHFSDARKDSGCEVSYVLRRYVRKPRKSPPGAVTFDHEKVIFVRIVPERLSRLLSSKRFV